MIKVVSTLKDVDGKNAITIGTHNGIFHSDEVVACAILCLLYGGNQIWIVRSRDPEELYLSSIVVDIGGGTFDHHMAGFNRKRKNGVMYASAGLVWQTFGHNLVNLFKEIHFPEYEIDFDEVFQMFDDEVISVVDREDNGVPCDLPNVFSFIPNFRPLWFETDSLVFNGQFEEALKATISVLTESLKSCMAKVTTKKILRDNWMDYDLFHDGILEIPSQTMDWVDTVIGFNLSVPCEFAKINFVMFPYPAGGWAAQCVPPSFDDKFGQRIPFPKAWAGKTDELPEITGVPTATFCHNGCFFVRAKEKDDVTALCKLAMNR